MDHDSGEGLGTHLADKRGRSGRKRIAQYKVQGQQRVDLSWSGATSNSIDIYRNNVLIATVPNIPGFHTDNIGARGKGTYTYRVCGAGTQNCSNQVTVKFGGG
jgi:serine protease